MQTDDSGPTLAQGPVRLDMLLEVTAIGGYFLWSLFSENTAYLFDPRIWWSILLAGLEGFAMGQVLHGSATTTEAIRLGRALINRVCKSV